MKTIANKVQKTFEASIRMLMIKEGMKFEQAQNVVLEVVKEFQKPNVTKEDMVDLYNTLQLTFLR